MLTLETEKQIRSFLGKVNYIARFIVQLTATCDSLFKLLKKDVKIDGQMSAKWPLTRSSSIC